MHGGAYAINIQCICNYLRCTIVKNICRILCILVTAIALMDSLPHIDNKSELEKAGLNKES
jgi:hypothetical protein